MTNEGRAALVKALTELKEKRITRRARIEWMVPQDRGFENGYLTAMNDVLAMIETIEPVKV
jgi:hypothetical protein